jgi:protein CWC15
MTTAHRPTFDPARGKEAQRGVAYHQRLLPAHTQLKVRKPGQGGDADSEVRDLRAELLAAEAAHFAKRNGTPGVEATATQSKAPKRALGDAPPGIEGPEAEDPETKRRRVLEETRDIDADSDGADSDSSDEDSDDEEDETAELMRELEKIKRERAEQKAKEEAEKAAQDQEQREEDIALGNPLLNPQAFNVKRRWDDDVIFKNQARGTEQKGKKEFVNVWWYCPTPLCRADNFDLGPPSIRLPQEIHVQIRALNVCTASKLWLLQHVL